VVGVVELERIEGPPVGWLVAERWDPNASVPGVVPSGVVTDLEFDEV
jgi:hypothetical protein